MLKQKAIYKQNCISMYEKNVERYIHTYSNDYKGYPANQKRLEILLKLVRRHKPKRILYVGCGACIPMVTLIRNFDCQVVGIDFSGKMIERGREVLEQFKINPELAKLGDIEHFNTLPDGLFDFAIAAGVFTHLADDETAMHNLNLKLKTGGGLAIEFRNELFSCYSFNRYSYDFFSNYLIDDIVIKEELREKVEIFFKHIFNTPIEEEIPAKSTHMKNDYVNKFHNPLNISKLFDDHGFAWIKNYFYHYHIFPPQFEKIDAELYQSASLNLENPTDWRGHIMASAFVSEAKKNICI